jgi:hypothetical protein
MQSCIYNFNAAEKPATDFAYNWPAAPLIFTMAILTAHIKDYGQLSNNFFDAK